MEQIAESFAETLREILETQNQELRAEVAAHLIAIGAIDPTLKVKLASGIETTGYANLRPSGLNRFEGFPVVHLFARYVQQIISAYTEQGVEIKALGGVPMGGLIWSYRLFASYLQESTDWNTSGKLTHFIANKEPRGEGPNPEQKIDIPKRLRDGTSEAPVNVILIEDVVTTGGSAAVAIGDLQNEGLRTVAVVTIVQRDDIEPVDDISGVPVYSLFRMSELVDSVA